MPIAPNKRAQLAGIPCRYRFRKPAWIASGRGTFLLGRQTSAGGDTSPWFPPQIEWHVDRDIQSRIPASRLGLHPYRASGFQLVLGFHQYRFPSVQVSIDTVPFPFFGDEFNDDHQR